MGVSIWGKIIGGTAGFALGGPIGALLGGVAGHALDRMRARASGGHDTRQMAFTVGVIVLGAKMAKADGVVTRDEIRAFRRVFHVPPQDAGGVARVFDRAKEDSRGFEPYARQLAALFADNPAVLEDLLDALFHIAQADRVYHPAEDAYLRSVAEIFGFDEAEFSRIRASHVGPEEADPYAVLGVGRDVPDGDLKRRYRALVREHHPDRLIAQGVPREMIDVATAKLASINDAWDRIARERDLA